MPRLPQHIRPWAASLVLIALPALAASALAQRLIPGKEAAFPRVKYADSLESPNDRCMVAAKKLSPKVRPVYVNGVPMGFC